MKRKCANCRHFADGPPAHCRRRPPERTEELSSTFPVTLPAWNCGEHKYSVRRLLRGNRVLREAPAGGVAGNDPADPAVGK